jgi:pantoate--beta-alanine ligase
MIVVQSIEEARINISAVRKKDAVISFVPTMGALHNGHLSLIRKAKSESSFCVMSIFVNRIQFNDTSDFDKYPRDYDHDLALAEIAGCDMVFLPDDTIMYHDHHTFVIPEFLDEHLCGAARPGHFRGVCTVVTKLFNIIQPDIAFFGQKDIQQAIILKKMAIDLNIPVEIVIAPIVRENDGLAMSSRNVHLSPDQRKRSVSLFGALRRAEELIKSGEQSSSLIEREAREFITREGIPDRIDYISIVDMHTLHPVDTIRGKCVLALAVFFGATRLIDNMIIDMETSPQCVY